MNLKKHFSRVYVEHGAECYPLAKKVLSSAGNQATVVPIEHYKDVFNRPRQDWDLQHSSRSIILAVRKKSFLYDGSEYAPSFGHARFFYNTLVLNCLYDCSYCYLQGMFPSAHIVVFVNQDEFFEATDAELVHGPLYLCISYDTDLLAFEGVLGLSRLWLDFASERTESLTIELRTKSAHMSLIRKYEPMENVVLAWTISPQDIIAQYERKTPRLMSRIKALQFAVSQGWKVRLCLDPILRTAAWKENYHELFSVLEQHVSLADLHQISIGVFRMHKGYLRNIRNRGRRSDIIFDEYETQGKSVSYPEAETKDMCDTVARLAEAHIDSSRIVIW